MNDLPRACWAHIEPLLRESGCAYDPPLQTPGRLDIYYVARFTANVTNVVLNLYHDRVSLILGGDCWLPFLSADYADADALAADLVSKVREALDSDSPWEPPSPFPGGVR